MRLGFVRRARELGFTLDEIRALLRLAEDRDRPCAEAREVAAAHLTDIRTKIADLQAMESVLADTVVRCADGKTPECPPLETLFGPHRSAERRVGIECVCTCRLRLSQEP